MDHSSKTEVNTRNRAGSLGSKSIEAGEGSSSKYQGQAQPELYKILSQQPAPHENE